VEDVLRVGGEAAIRLRLGGEPRRAEVRVHPHSGRQHRGAGKAAGAALGRAATLEGAAVRARVRHGRHRREEHQGGQQAGNEKSGASCHGCILLHAAALVALAVIRPQHEIRLQPLNLCTIVRAMATDPIVDEIHAIREEIARRHDYDMDAIVETFQKASAQSGRRVVTLPPKPVVRHERARKAS
jgi:hypothetical protein